MSRLTPETLSSLIGDIYDCILNPDGWAAALARIAGVLDAAYATVSLSRVGDMHGLMAAHSPWDADMLRSLNQDYGVAGVPGLKEVVFGDCDTPISTLAFMSEDEFQRSEFYRNWVRPQGLRDGCVVKFVHTADRIGMLGVITRANRDIITADERRFIGLLSPHFRRAGLIGDLLNHERVQANVYRDVLDGLGSAVVLTNADGCIAYANAAAEAMFAALGPVTRSNGRIGASNPAMVAALATAIAQAATNETALGARGIGIPVSAPDAPPAVAYVLPLTQGTARAAFQPAVAAIFITTAISAAPAPEETLITLFDLTPAEARVMQRIGGGMAADAAAAGLGISANTLKTHLGRVFNKTGTSRQSDLALLVANIAPPLRLET